MSEEKSSQFDKALRTFMALNKEQIKLFLFAAKMHLQNLNNEDGETQEEISHIDELKMELSTTQDMIRKVYFGEAKIVYDVYGEDAISFEDNQGNFLW